jgi:hypothetical protein
MSSRPADDQQRAYHYGSSSLTRHHAGFQRDGMLTVLEFANDRIQQDSVLS